METNELIAIVGGSLAGLVVILIVLAVIIYCTCGKRKRRDDKHRRLTHNQSQDTSLGKSSKYGNGIDPRMEHPPLCQKLGVMVCGWEQTPLCMPLENPTTTTIEGLRTP